MSQSHSQSQPQPQSRPARKLFSSAPPRICTIAGSDSGGGAGIQADLKTILSLGGYGLSAITALTAQNTTGVKGVHSVPAEFVQQQLAALQDDIAIDAFKVGMLANDNVVQTVAAFLRATRQGTSDVRNVSPPPPIVVDPVMVSTSGSLLLEEQAIEHLIQHVLPLCHLLTPNIPEAESILRVAYGGRSKYTTSPSSSSSSLGNNVQSLPDLMRAAHEICQLGPEAVLVKGGHLELDRNIVEHALQQLVPNNTSAPYSSVDRAASEFPETVGCDIIESSDGEVAIIRMDCRPWSAVLASRAEQQQQKGSQVVVDVLYERGSPSRPRGRFTVFFKPRLNSSATHGTGCTLSSAIATYLSGGCSTREATALGIEYVQASIARGIADLGRGPGPLNHASLIFPRAIGSPCADAAAAPGEHMPLVRSLIGHCLDEWERFVRHPFVEAIANATLPDESFVFFLEQDYLFLRQYANVWAMAAAKATSFEDIRRFSNLSLAMADESELHVKLCAQWGIIRETLLQKGRSAIAESAATLAYTRFAVDVAERMGTLEILVATLPCMLGYAEIGCYLGQKVGAIRRADHKQKEWIDAYASNEFRRTALSIVDHLEKLADEGAIMPARLKQLQHLFAAAVRLEQDMWTEAMNAQTRRRILEAA
ncbi:hypothetical protein K437DRAFT_192618 [Tilletiaria anomala UBC 951]|uniref:Phosphomethylpyrimidine kinase n=1 Tax=Tilletiaria anomala (strain ATCC 24038 / CBS 436.72 / UBC 951) TaxID=1037660 RepID=A0A066VE43_TILAU|nr:uncharacterized protein K437DRAFT_192618 [Tilletiaria anomala UBC 951]KDN40012.1 hypothetical protein K437DRAFT_192618 [Tilletiaria anomala UBC 951]